MPNGDLDSVAPRSLAVLERSGESPSRVQEAAAVRQAFWQFPAALVTAVDAMDVVVAHLALVLPWEQRQDEAVAERLRS